MNDIDLRAELHAIFERHGHWAVLRKRDLTKRCACFNETTHEAMPRCGKCAGTGYALVDHFVRVRYMPLAEMTEAPGPSYRMQTSTIRYWFQHHVKPDVGDFLAELDLDEASLKSNAQIQPSAPFRIRKLFDIQTVTPMREAGGRVEFFNVLVEPADFGDTA